MSNFTIYKSQEQKLLKGRRFVASSLNVFLILFLTFASCSNTFAQVVIDNTSSNGPISSSNSITVSHTTGTDNNRLMLVGVSCANRLVTAVAYGGTLLEEVAFFNPTSRTTVYIFQLINPPSGTADVVVTFASNLAGSAVGSVGAMTFSNVDQISPLGSVVTNNGSNNSPSISVPGSASQLIYAVLSADNSNINGTGAGQTEQWRINGARPRSAGSTKPSSGVSTSMTHTLAGNTGWALVGIPINPFPTSDLSVSKLVSESKPFVGQVINFTITATNNGPDNVGGVQVLDFLPDGYTYISDTPTSGTYDFNTGIWDVGQINNGGSETLTLEVVVNSSGPYLNTATVSGLATDNVPGNNTSSVGITICNAGGSPPLYTN